MLRKSNVVSLKKHSNKRILGQWSDDRQKENNYRKTFIHWEIDTVIGNKIKTDDVLLTLFERQTRLEVIMKVNGKNQECVNQAIHTLQAQSDNGSEFVGLDEVLKDTLDVYFSHLYASLERGTSENQHKIICRFIPKVKPIS